MSVSGYKVYPDAEFIRSSIELVCVAEAEGISSVD